MNRYEENNWSPMKCSDEWSPMNRYIESTPRKTPGTWPKNGGWDTYSPMETVSGSPVAPVNDSERFLHHTQRTPSSIQKIRRTLDAAIKASSPIKPASKITSSGKLIWSKDQRPREKALMSSYIHKSVVDYLKKCNPRHLVLCVKYNNGDSQLGVTGTEENVDNRDLTKTMLREFGEEVNAFCPLETVSSGNINVFAGSFAKVEPKGEYVKAPVYPKANSWKPRKVAAVVTGSESDAIKLFGQMTHPSDKTGYNDNITSWAAIPVSDAIIIGEIGMSISAAHYMTKTAGCPPPFWYCFETHSQIAEPAEMTDDVLNPMDD